jgi:hypothetical protein
MRSPMFKVDAGSQTSGARPNHLVMFMGMLETGNFSVCIAEVFRRASIFG